MQIMKSLSLLIFSILIVCSAHGQTKERWIVTTPTGCISNTFLEGNVTINYAGECLNNYLSGKGSIKVFKDGVLDGVGTGEFKDGKPNGWLTYKYSDGRNIVGQIKEGLLHGQAIFQSKEGKVKLGEWKNNKPDGHFIEFNSDGSIDKSGIYENGKLLISQSIDINKFKFIISDYLILAEENKKNSINISKQENQSLLLPNCSGRDPTLWDNCLGTTIVQERHSFLTIGDKYTGEFKKGKAEGKGIFTFVAGGKYQGGFKNNMADGYGIFTFKNGNQYKGEFKENHFHGYAVLTTSDEKIIARGSVLDGGFFAIYINNYDDVLKKFRSQVSDIKLSISAEVSSPDNLGVVNITINTNKNTSSLKINDEELGSKIDGNYFIKKVVRIGQETKFIISAIDVNGNTGSKTISVMRQVEDLKPVFEQLDASNIKQHPVKDAVAIIIGIEKYKRVAKADFANADALDFYDYAVRALGIKPENIKLLVDEAADDVEIYKAFQNWLPVKVNKGKTDVFVFYSGHGYPGQDGNSLYILPFGADKDLISKTAINQQEIISSLQAAQPRAVTMFIDSCYSGQTRGGDILIAGARPFVPKTILNAYPQNFTVITASANDQISSASQELKHGIFSYYLMKGMEGDADKNKDGKIIVSEMQEYLTDMVGRHAMGINRKQQPQFFGDSEKVLVSK